jgi:hypothetical protein
VGRFFVDSGKYLFLSADKQRNTLFRMPVDIHSSVDSRNTLVIDNSLVIEYRSSSFFLMALAIPYWSVTNTSMTPLRLESRACLSRPSLLLQSAIRDRLPPPLMASNIVSTSVNSDRGDLIADGTTLTSKVTVGFVAPIPTCPETAICELPTLDAPVNSDTVFVVPLPVIVCSIAHIANAVIQIATTAISLEHRFPYFRS